MVIVTVRLQLVLLEEPCVQWPENDGEVTDVRGAIRRILSSAVAYEVTKDLHPRRLEDAEPDELTIARDEVWQGTKQMDDFIKELIEAKSGPFVATTEQQPPLPPPATASLAAGMDTAELLRLTLVLQHNGFASGLYHRLSMINHSCAPNCLKISPPAKLRGWRRASEVIYLEVYLHFYNSLLDSRDALRSPPTTKLNYSF